MNILIANHRYFMSGGPERYMFSISRLLEKKGHKVIPFSINYTRNEKTEYSKYFVLPPVNGDHAFYADSRLNLYRKLKMFGKVIYNFEAKRKIKQVIKKEKIDIVYALQIVNFLYPSIIDGCYEMGVPVVARLSDFQLICPSYTLLRGEKICEDCKSGYYGAVKNKCLQNSRFVSLARVCAMYFHKFIKTTQKIDAFIAPSDFLRNKMTEFHFEPLKIHHIPTFVESNDCEPNYKHKDYILFVGMILKHKGLECLIKAFANINSSVTLKIVGYSRDSEEAKWKKYIQERGIKNIEFLGGKTKSELAELYRNTMFVVFPSIWYENMPNVILESMSYGKPVIGSNLGSIPELIDDGWNGLLFRPGDQKDLYNKIQYLLDNKPLLVEMGKRARKKVISQYNCEQHYENLMNIYQKLL